METTVQVAKSAATALSSLSFRSLVAILVELFTPMIMIPVSKIARTIPASDSAHFSRKC